MYMYNYLTKAFHYDTVKYRLSTCTCTGFHLETEKETIS